MSTYEIVPATARHARALAPRMREADVREVWAVAHYTPKEALQSGLAVSRDTITALVDGQVVAMGGVGHASVLGNLGTPWLLGSEELPRHARHFLRDSRRYVELARQDYAKLENYVDASNTEAIKWLSWLGFEMDEPAPFGIERVPFRRFHMKGLA